MSRYLLSLIIFFSATAIAGDFHAVFNGRAVHFEGQNWNERNWGLGFQYDFEPQGSWIPAVSGSIFRDSNKDISRYLGVGMRKRFVLSGISDKWHADLGVFGFLMTRKDFRDNDPFLGALPFVSIGNERVSVNMTYIPAITAEGSPLAYFQVTTKLMEF